MALGLTQPVTKMSTRYVSLGGKGGRCVGLTTLPSSCADCLQNLRVSDSWKPQGLSRPVMGLLYSQTQLVMSILLRSFYIDCLNNDMFRPFHRSSSGCSVISYKVTIQYTTLFLTLVIPMCLFNSYKV